LLQCCLQLIAGIQELEEDADEDEEEEEVDKSGKGAANKIKRPRLGWTLLCEHHGAEAASKCQDHRLELAKELDCQELPKSMQPRTTGEGFVQVHPHVPLIDTQ
jgi:hypothetical protein